MLGMTPLLFRLLTKVTLERRVSTIKRVILEGKALVASLCGIVRYVVMAVFNSSMMTRYIQRIISVYTYLPQLLSSSYFSYSHSPSHLFSTLTRKPPPDHLVP